MPQVQAPDGHVMDFPEGTSPEQMHQQMLGYWNSRPQQQQTAGAPVLAKSGQIPGTTPSGLEPNPKAPDAPLVPLSDQAEYDQRLGMIGGFSNNRALATYGTSQYSSDPTVAARKAEGTELGKQAAALAGRREAGSRIIPGVDALRTMIDNAGQGKEGDEIWQNAAGPYNSTKMRPEIEFPLHPMAYKAPEMTPTQARMMFGTPLIGNDPHSAANSKAWDLQNSLEHLVGALTDQYIASAGGAAVVNSDARMQVFKDMMDKVRFATSRKEAHKILDTAEDAARNVFALAPRSGSATNPIPVQNPQEALAHRSGTYVRRPDGKLAQVP